MDATIFCTVVTKKEMQLPLYITTIGTTYREAHIYRPDGVESYQLLYSKHGSGVGKLYGKNFEIPKGSLYCLPANTAHDYYNSTEDWETHWVTFSGWASQKLFDIEAGVYSLPEGFDFDKKLKDIMACRNMGEWGIKSSVLLYELLLELKEHISVRYRAKNRLSECIRYINDNYAECIELSELARISEMSEEHFCRVFKSYTGMRPFEYITNVRIQRAKEFLLRGKSEKVRKIAEITGFKSACYFSAVFKKLNGCTPEQYRSENS